MIPEEQVKDSADKLYYALVKYVKAQVNMLNKWAEGDDAVKNDLWKRLHECEPDAMEALEQWEKHTVKNITDNE